MKSMTRSYNSDNRYIDAPWLKNGISRLLHISSEDFKSTWNFNTKFKWPRIYNHFCEAVRFVVFPLINCVISFLMCEEREWESEWKRKNWKENLRKIQNRTMLCRLMCILHLHEEDHKSIVELKTHSRLWTEKFEVKSENHTVNGSYYLFAVAPVAIYVEQWSDLIYSNNNNNNHYEIMDNEQLMNA